MPNYLWVILNLVGTAVIVGIHALYLKRLASERTLELQTLYNQAVDAVKKVSQEMAGEWDELWLFMETIKGWAANARSASKDAVYAAEKVIEEQTQSPSRAEINPHTSACIE